MQTTPFELQSDFTIRIVSKPEQAETWLRKGYTPVECSFGPKSVVDELTMDHHGPYSDLEGVAIRAYRDHFGARADKPKFVTTGFPDEDATWAMAALAGILPHPSMAEKFPDAPLQMRTAARQNYLHVAEEINRVDLNPDLAITLTDTFWGLLVLSWRQQAHPTCTDKLAWMGGVDRWRALVTSQSDEFINASAGSQEEKLAQVAPAPSEHISKDVVVVDLSRFGRNSSYYSKWLEKYPVVVAFIGGPQGYGTCSFIARDIKTANRLFGDGGFIKHYANLIPGGCGGREIIGGSSRASYINWDHAQNYGRQWQTIIEQHKENKKKRS